MPPDQAIILFDPKRSSKICERNKSVATNDRGRCQNQQRCNIKVSIFFWCPGSETPVSGVKKLGPGELIVWQLDRPSKFFVGILKTI